MDIVLIKKKKKNKGNQDIMPYLYLLLYRETHNQSN